MGTLGEAADRTHSAAQLEVPNLLEDRRGNPAVGVSGGDRVEDFKARLAVPRRDGRVDDDVRVDEEGHRRSRGDRGNRSRSSSTICSSSLGETNRPPRIVLISAIARARSSGVALATRASIASRMSAPTDERRRFASVSRRRRCSLLISTCSRSDNIHISYTCLTVEKVLGRPRRSAPKRFVDPAERARGRPRLLPPPDRDRSGQPG
jgi:hypothetical protein